MYNFGDVQGIVNFSPGVTLTIEVHRGGSLFTLKAIPAEKDKRGMLGITRSNEPGDVRPEAVAPLEALQLGADRPSLVVTSTMAPPLDVVVGRQSADHIRRPTPIAPNSVVVGKPRLRPPP